MMIRTILFFLIITITITNESEISYKTLQVVQIQATYSKTEPISVNNTIMYVILFPTIYIASYSSRNPYRVKIWTDVANDNQVSVVVRQDEDVLSWVVPFEEESQLGPPIKFYDTARTLCSSSIVGQNNISLSENFFIVLSTSSQNLTNIFVNVEEETNFFVEKNTTYSLRISPSQPKYFYYKFNETESKWTSVVVDIDSIDDTCFIASIQDTDCPVFDLNENINYEGRYETIKRKGAITVEKYNYPDGFFLVFVAKVDNVDCNWRSSNIPSYYYENVSITNHTTDVSFIIKSSLTVDEYKSATVTTFIIVISFFFLLLIIFVVFNYFGCKLLSGAVQEEILEEAIEMIEPGGRNILTPNNLLNLVTLNVENLSNNPNLQTHTSCNYLRYVCSIGLFYGIPVVQLVIIYSRMANQEGNEDLCYYNFRCSHHLFGLADFNHVISNISYGFAAILFFIIVVCRHKCSKRADERNLDEGIPQHYDLFYSMSAALIFEGLFSALYHLCPNQANFQFDTSFMYVMTILCMIKLYENRHPDLRATAYATFFCLGLTILLVTIGMLYNFKILWILFSLIFIGFVAHLSLQLYYLGFVIDGIKMLKNDIIEKLNDEENSVLSALKPKKRNRFYVVLAGNIFNWVLLVILLLKVNDFGTFVLGIMIGNAVTYTIFYMIMKWYHKEHFCYLAIMYGIFALIVGGFAIKFFQDSPIDWKVTAAESRQQNAGCIFLDFFDSHDIWHMLSALTLFLIFMCLLHIDDGLNKPRRNIPVF